MSVGVDASLDERWDAAKPECGEDTCLMCWACLGCDAGKPCPDMGREGHVWLNSKDEVRLV